MKEKTLLSITVLSISICHAHNLRRSQAGKDSPRLRLKRIHRKIAKGEEEISTRSFNWFA